MTLIEKSETASPRAVEAALVTQKPMDGSGTRTGPALRDVFIRLPRWLWRVAVLPVLPVGARTGSGPVQRAGCLRLR
jgi:hypothetical protein